MRGEGWKENNYRNSEMHESLLMAVIINDDAKKYRHL